MNVHDDLERANSVPPQPPSSTDVQSLVREARANAIALLMGGLIGIPISLAVMYAASEVVGFLALLVSGYALSSSYGRIWALGGPRLDRWEDAEASVWFVRDAEVETDWDNDAVWYHLRITPAAAPRPADRTTRSYPLAVRLCPRKTGSGCDWRGKFVFVVKAADGLQVTCLAGDSHVYRADGASPWDWLGV